jgi:hypothetical protein
VTSSDIPYVVGAVLALGGVLGEGWVKRRTGQSWWVMEHLGRGFFTALVAVLVVYAGHPVLALLPGAVAASELISARRNWVEHGSRDVLERNRLELESPDAPPGRPIRRSSALGLRKWVFISATAGLWTLLDEQWGLSWISAGLVAAVIAVIVFHLRPRRSSPPGPPNGEEFGSPMARFGTHATPRLGGNSEQSGRDVTAERQFQFEGSGRPARVLGWLFERLVRVHESGDE